MFSKHAVCENLVHQKNDLCSLFLCPGSAAVQLKKSMQRELHQHHPVEETAAASLCIGAETKA